MHPLPEGVYPCIRPFPVRELPWSGEASPHPSSFARRPGPRGVAERGAGAGGGGGGAGRGVGGARGGTPHPPVATVAQAPESSPSHWDRVAVVAPGKVALPCAGKVPGSVLTMGAPFRLERDS